MWRPGITPYFLASAALARSASRFARTYSARIVPPHEFTVDKLIEVGTIIIEPVVYVAGRAAFVWTGSPQTVDRHMRKSRPCELSHEGLAVKSPCRSQTADEKVIEIAQPGEGRTVRQGFRQPWDRAVNPVLCDHGEKREESGGVCCLQFHCVIRRPDQFPLCRRLSWATHPNDECACLSRRRFCTDGNLRLRREALAPRFCDCPAHSGIRLPDDNPAKRSVLPAVP